MFPDTHSHSHTRTHNPFFTPICMTIAYTPLSFSLLQVRIKQENEILDTLRQATNFHLPLMYQLTTLLAVHNS